MQSRLRAQCGRSYQRVIDGLAVCITEDATVIVCASLADRLAVLDALLGALRSIVADLRLPPAIRVTKRPPNGPEPSGGVVSPLTSCRYRRDMFGAPPRAASRDGRCFGQREVKARA